MPFYEYECSACKYYVEVMQKITDAPMTKCPSCGKEELQRLISAPVFRLKGAGWYETDFKSDKENKRNLVDTGADDKEPAAKSDDEDKKVKVRASKALKKVVVKKKAGKKSAKRPAKKAAKPKPKAKSRSKAGKQPARKSAPNKAARKVTRKVAKKAVQKAAKRPARKK